MREVMYINNKPLYDFGAKLLDWEVTPAVTNVIANGKNLFPSLLKSDIGQKTLSVTLNYQTADRKWFPSPTALIGALNKTVNLQMPDGFIYRSALSSVSSVQYPAKWIAEFTLTFSCVQCGQYQEINIIQDKQPIYYSGTAPAPYKIEFTAPSAMQSITVQGIQLTSIPAGAKIVIDGLEKTVTQNGANKFLETNLIDFPVFEPSELPIEISVSPFVPLKIGYYPIYM